MRLLVTADLHYALRQFDWLGEQAQSCDVLILAGDLLDLASAVDLEVQTVVVQKYLRRYAGQRVLLTASGNHDILEASGSGERSAWWMEELAAPGLHPDFGSYERDGVLFTVCAWWDGPEGRRRTEERLASDATKPKRLWIWVHHGPPKDAPVAWTGTHDGGDGVVAEWIRTLRPDLVFSGHIHNAPFYAVGDWCCKVGDTWVFNSGKQPGREPTRIVVDLATGHAEWHSMEGVAVKELGLIGSGKVESG